ncbi:antitoxin YxxD [Clostridia bacterium]|nr:antitoxin YxxD [Clostridia bacterium]
MSYKFLTKKNNTFYPVSSTEIIEVENSLDLVLPNSLKDLYNEIGYGFIKGSENNVNRILDPYSIRDFRMRENDFEFYPDIEIYTEFEIDKVIFFEGNESVLISIGFTENNKNAIFYYNTQIAASLMEFLQKLQDNDMYYMDLI